MFTLTINTDKAAFDGDGEINTEIARILRSLGDTVEGDYWHVDEHAHGTVRDINGNTVGSWTLDPREDTEE